MLLKRVMAECCAVNEKRLYHPIFFLIALIFLLLSACSATPTPEALIDVRLLVDGQEFLLRLPPGSTVQEALDGADVVLGSLDRVDPVAYTVLADQTLVTVVRVREEFEVEQVIIPFEQQGFS